MVRAGVVKHPKDWPYGGYQEIINQKQRFTLINKKKLNSVLGLEGEKIEEKYQLLLHEYLINSNLEREKCWTESICIGNKEFVKNFQNKLNIKTVRRKIIKNRDHFILRENENPNPYSSFFNSKKSE
jgi:putative transposase